MDTSESLRNLQQEIESLLAPLTPLPDLDQVHFEDFRCHFFNTLNFTGSKSGWESSKEVGLGWRGEL